MHTSLLLLLLPPPPKLGGCDWLMSSQVDGRDWDALMLQTVGRCMYLTPDAGRLHLQQFWGTNKLFARLLTDELVRFSAVRGWSETRHLRAATDARGWRCALPLTSHPVEQPRSADRLGRIITNRDRLEHAVQMCVTALTTHTHTHTRARVMLAELCYDVTPWFSGRDLSAEGHTRSLADAYCNAGCAAK